MPKTDQVLTSGEAARLLEVDPATVRNYARSGRLPTIFRTGRGLHLFERAAVERLARERDQARDDARRGA
jgi:excisionase family DNA binding protein